MPPKSKPQEQKDEKKQKSLLGWLSKPAATKVANSSSAVTGPVMSSSPSGRDSIFETPSNKKRTTLGTDSPAVRSANFTRSDPIDVDMSSDEDLPRRDMKSARTKRKIAIEDSDEGEQYAAANKKVLSAYRPSQESGRAKEALMTPSEDDPFDNQDDTPSVFSQTLSKFKRPPKKKARRTRPSDDDDDEFIVPDDSEDDLASRSSRASKRSSRQSLLSDYDDDETGTQTTKAKKSAGASGRPPLKKAHGTNGSASASASNFLTAAEQRAQATKDGKKSQEDPFSFLLDVRDKDGVRPGEPGYDPRTLYVPKKAWNDFSPFEKQFWEIKQNHFDTVAKFLELYEEDARIGHREFDLKLTTRVKMSMVGVPEMAFNFWAAKFLAKDDVLSSGYKVGRVDQSETALGAEMRVAANKSRGKGGDDKQKEKSELNKVYTNGTLVDDELLTDDQAGHCLSIREDDGGSEFGSFGICVLDSATSEFNLSAFDDDICRTKLETLLRQLRPKEIVFTKGNLSVATTRLLKVILPGTCLWTSLRDVEGFGYDETLSELKTLYAANSQDAMDDDDYNGLPTAIRDMIESKNVIEALGSMMWYLRQLNIDKDILTMNNFNIYDPMKKGQGLVLDGQSLAHIEVLLNSEGTEEGSLLQLLSRCVTPFGKRLFRIWLCVPLRDVADINARLDAVEDLMNHPTFEGDFMEVAKGLPDLERIVSRIHAKNCKVKDFLKVLKQRSIQVADASETFESKTILGLLRSAPDLLPHVKNVELRFEKPENNNDDLLPVEGKDEAYDEIAQEIRELEKELDRLLKRLERQVGTPLQYWHSAQGNKDIYLVQVSSQHRDIPKDWNKSGGTKAFTRWSVPALAGTVRQLKEARERRSASIKDFKFRLFAEFDKDRGVWLRAIRVLAELDCLFSLAKSSNALGEPACRPQLVEGDVAWIDFEELRHPAMALRTKSDFIPNDVKLGGKLGRIALLTGCYRGKSTVMRMTAAGICSVCILILSSGCNAPDLCFRLCPVDTILTRMGAYDNMFSNSSTFKVELDECCKIMRDATPKSFVVLDELGRGTSTYDGMAIAGAVLHRLATHTLALAFFATHYGSLTDDYAYHANIRNMHMKTLVDDEKRELVFLYKLIDGIATSSFGTHVANLAGVPLDVVERAELISKDFASKFKEKIEGKRKTSAFARLPIDAQADFAYLYKLAGGKCDLDADVVRRREVLKGLKVSIGRRLEQSSVT
ncbi:muts domain V-domain-containing protein [Russula brevipes]|nr:muts domain V-domain-containing protein [Russula brevipes]